MKRTVLITGASAGFGAACARLYAKHDDDLVLVARRAERLESVRKALPDTCTVHTEVLDVRDRKRIEAFAATLPALLTDKGFSSNNIDILINNAGLALGLNPIPLADPEDWETMIDTNIKGLLYFTQAIVPMMVAKNRGHIVNLGSIAGTWPYVGGNVYGATKAFVKQFSRNLRADLLGKNIRVTNIEPGLAESEFSIVRFKGDRQRADQVYEGTDPLTPEDIADIIHWVTSLPPHVNINALEVMPVCQAWDCLKVNKEMKKGT